MTGIAPYLSSTATALVSLHTGPFTITCWFLPTVQGDTYTPTTFLSGPAWSVNLDADGTVSFLVKNSVSGITTTVTSSEVVTGNWNFIGVVYDPNSMVITLWVNGVPASTTLLALADSTMSSVSPFDDFELGNPDMRFSFTPDGFALDATGVWARALPSADILTIYNNGQGSAYPFLGGNFTLIFQANLVNEIPTPLVICSQNSVYQIGESSVTTEGSAGQRQAFFTPLYNGTNTLITPGFNWTADNFSDKVILAQHDNPALYWTPPSTTALPLPGLPLSQQNWDGVCVFQNHVVLWSGDTLLWSDVNNFTNYIPVAETAVSAVLNITGTFTQPPPGGSVVVQVANPQASVASLSLSGNMTFASTDVGSSAQALLSLENTGNVPLTITGIALPAGFSVSPSVSFPLTIPVNGSQGVIIVFSPTAAITYSGSIVVGSNATTGTSVYPISGTGSASTMVINLSGNLAFGSVIEGFSLTSALVVTNTGNSTLNVTGVTLPLGFSTTFTTGSVAAGDNLIIPVVFTPSATLLYTGDTTVNSNATSGTNFINVSGTGLRAGTAPQAGVFMTDNGTCQFGSVQDGDTATGTITITNTTGAPIYLYPPTAPGGFAAGNPGVVHPAQLAAHASTTLTVTFEPTLAQSYGGFVVVPCAAVGGGAVAGNNAILVTGTGTVTGAIIELSGSLNYGDVPFGGSLQAMLTIFNPGSSNLVISSITYPANFTGISSATIAPGETLNTLVTFTPAASGGSQIDYSGDITLVSNATNLPTATYAVSGSGIPSPAPLVLVAGQVVTLTDRQGLNTYYNYYTVTAMTGTSLSLTLQALTGASPAGSIMGLNSEQFFTVDANEAGTTVVAGSRMNGPIFDMIPQGDYAYIFKTRSIQSVQYTGLGNGTFFIHNEISGEGPIGRNAVTDDGDGKMFFLGHKELYLYIGGPNLQPVCQQYTRQLYAELDRTRLNNVVVFHNENRKEIWVQYPVTGGSYKVLVWNYVEDSATIDIYDPSVAFTALGLVDWSNDPTWASFASSTAWDDLPSSTTWASLVAQNIDHAPVFGSMDNGLRLHGEVYDREGAAYTALSETMDYDLGSPDIWKYCDVVVLGIQLPTVVPVPAGSKMYVQIGSQNSLSGAAITWTNPIPVLVDGTAPQPIKVNPGGSGRYLRLRFYSQDPDVQWRVSSFEVHCRPGGTY